MATVLANAGSGLAMVVAPQMPTWQSMAIGVAGGILLYLALNALTRNL